MTQFPRPASLQSSQAVSQYCARPAAQRAMFAGSAVRAVPSARAVGAMRCGEYRCGSARFCLSMPGAMAPVRVAERSVRVARSLVSRTRAATSATICRPLFRRCGHNGLGESRAAFPRSVSRRCWRAARTPDSPTAKPITRSGIARRVEIHARAAARHCPPSAVEASPPTSSATPHGGRQRHHHRQGMARTRRSQNHKPVHRGQHPTQEEGAEEGSPTGKQRPAKATNLEATAHHGLAPRPRPHKALCGPEAMFAEAQRGQTATIRNITRRSGYHGFLIENDAVTRPGGGWLPR